MVPRLALGTDRTQPTVTRKECNMMKPGDFTTLAENYAKYRPGYSLAVRKALLCYVGADRPGFQAADVGAGTGIWTRLLAEAGVSITGIEPNDAMRAQGEVYTKGASVQWRPGSAEQTGLGTASVDWITMASSFHWVKQPDGLQEFHRALKPGGYLTVLWNPRDIEGNALHEQIEQLIHDRVPGLKRVSSGGSKHARDYYQELIAGGLFEDVVFFEAKHELIISKDHYIGAWRSVNDIQVQAGPERFEQLLTEIRSMVEPMDQIVVPYKTRAWTARRVGS